MLGETEMLPGLCSGSIFFVAAIFLPCIRVLVGLRLASKRKLTGR